MKKIIYILSAVLLTASCNFLDFDETSGDYKREDMYKTYSNIQKMLTNIYGYMPYKDIVEISDAMRDCGCDDAEFGDPDGSVQRFNNGNWSAQSTVDTKWTFYNAIRCVNEFLESMQTVDISIYKQDSKYALWMEHLKYYPQQARVLRAYYLFELARRYGDIAMPLTMLSTEEANSIGKTPFDKVIDYIVSECDECAQNLPDTYIGMYQDEYGRVTRGFAMAVKAKALLYAASPLHNPGGDKEKWQKAAKAAKDIMDLKLYALDPLETANTGGTSPEVILQIMRSESQSFEKYNFPVRFTLGKRTSMSGTYPTQNLVDAFQTLGGYDITLDADGWHTADPDFDLAHPYEGRDPRFARAILADGMTFKSSTIETFVGGADYSATRADLGSPTGYYLRRYILPDTDFTPEAEVKLKHSWILSRYAEVLLSYAEALNEYLGPDATDATFSLSARQVLNQVRDNAGMPAVTVTGQEAFRSAVQREWRVEFAFEDHRFWDVRRWKIGADTQKQVYGVQIVKGAEKKEYSRVLVENRVWADRMYLYPIPQSELFCNTNLGPQNPGW